MKGKLDYDLICQNIGYKFRDDSILTTAFTHSSFAHQFSTSSNERLEFLGDAVLDFLVADYLYQKDDLVEGEMSKMRSFLVSSDSLSSAVNNMGLAEMLLIGDSLGGVVTKSMQEDLFEAIVGAIYLDGGLLKAREFIFSHIDIDAVKRVDYKTKLQEIVQKATCHEPQYVTDAEPKADGYSTKLYINDTFIIESTAHSKKESQIKCAKWALENINVVNIALKK